jgi:putative PEP-CTERM system TPR-repeat lipoprotein
MKLRAICSVLLLALLSFEITAVEFNDNYEKAATAFAKKHMTEALTFIKQALQENPNHLPSKILIAKIYSDAANLGAVEQELYEALALGADINLVLPLLGNALLFQKKTDKLLQLNQYQNSFSKQSQFEWALLAGQVALLNKQTKQAQTAFEQALSLFPQEPRVLNILGQLYLKLGLVDKAQALVDSSLTISPHNEKTLVLQGDIWLEQGDIARAIGIFNKAFAIDPRDLTILRRLAFSHLQMRQTAAVDKYIDLILNISANDPATVILTSWQLILKKETDPAKRSLIELNNKLAVLDEVTLHSEQMTYYIQGAAEYLQGNHEKARHNIQRHLAHFSDDLSAIRLLVAINELNEMAQQNMHLLESKKQLISKDLYLSGKLVQLYFDHAQLLRADDVLDQLQVNFPAHEYLGYLRAKLEQLRQRPEQALAILMQLPALSADKVRSLPTLLLTGELQLALNQLVAAEQTANELITSTTQNIDALNFIAAVFLKQNKWQLAEQYIDKVLIQDNSNVPALFNRAIMVKNQGHLTEAVQMLAAIVREHNQHFPSLLLLARLAMQQAEYDRALEWTKKVLVYDRTNRAALELQHLAYLQQNNLPQTIDTLERLLKLDRLNPNYLYAYIQVLVQDKQLAKVDHYAKILYGLWHDDAERLLQLAQIQASAQLFESANQSLNRSIELKPNVNLAFLALTRNYLQQNQQQAAAQMLTKMEQQFGSSAELLLLKGELAELQLHSERAQQYYVQSMQLNAENPQAILKLYQLAQQGIGDRQFIALLEPLMAQTDTPDWIRKLLADRYLVQGQHEQARQHYELLLNKASLANDASILNNLANIYAEYDLDKALLTARKGLASDEMNSALLDTIGWIYAKKRQWNQALSFLRQAFSMNATSPAIRYHLGYTLFNLGRVEEAKQELQAAIAKGDHFSEYQAALSLLNGI